MKSMMFLSLCFIVYILIIIFLVFKMKDISNNPKKYDVIPGYEKYRNSFWYENRYHRYGKHYYASLIIVILSLISAPLLYLLSGTLIQKYFLIPSNTVYLQSYQLILGCLPLLYFQIVFTFWISLHSKAPICIANSLYTFHSFKRSEAWKKQVISMLIVCILCLPVMAVCINGYCYANDEKIVTHNFLSLEENSIPYDTVVSAETTYKSNDNYTNFKFFYRITLQDGTQMNIMEFGKEGVLYLHSMFLQHDVPIKYGKIDPITYELMKRYCNSSTIQIVDNCFAVVP